MNLNETQVELCLFAIDFLKSNKDIISKRQFDKISESLDSAKHLLSIKADKIDVESVASLHLSLNVLKAIAYDEIDYDVDIITKHRCASNILEINYLISYFYEFIDHLCK